MKRSFLLLIVAFAAVLVLPSRADYVERTFLRRDMPSLCGNPWALQVGRSAVADLRQLRFIQGVVRVGDFEYPLDPWGIKQALDALDAGVANARAQHLEGAMTVEVQLRLDGLTLVPFSCVAYDSGLPYDVASRREIASGLDDSMKFFRRLAAIKSWAR